jgi:hypothetical protein
LQTPPQPASHCGQFSRCRLDGLTTQQPSPKLEPLEALSCVRWRGDVEKLSVGVAIVLLLTYVAGLFFSLRTRSDLAAAHELVPSPRVAVSSRCSRVGLVRRRSPGAYRGPPGHRSAHGLNRPVPPHLRQGRPVPGSRPSASDARPAPDAAGTTATLDRDRPAHLRCCGWATTIRVIYHTLDRGSVREPRVRRDRAPLTTTSRAAESRLAASLRSGRHEAKPVRPEGGRDTARRRRAAGWRDGLRAGQAGWSIARHLSDSFTRSRTRVS